MKKRTLLFGILIWSSSCFGQSDLAKLKVSFNSKDLSKDEDYIARVIFISTTHDKVLLPTTPRISDNVSDNGQLMIKYEVLVDSCFENIDISTDFFSPDTAKSHVTLGYQDSIFYSVDIRALGSLSPGFYRLKFYQKFQLNGKIKIVESNWKYLHAVGSGQMPMNKQRKMSE